MAKKKKIKYPEKYKPDYFMYMLILVIFALVRFIPFSLGSANLDDAVNDLAIGGSASALVALLIDIANCGKKNKELKEKQRMVFAEYCGAVNDLIYFIANRCKNFSQESDELVPKSWLEKLSDKNNYPENISPAITMNRAYFHIGRYTSYVKSTLISLKQQYCMLVESDIVDTDDFRQHLSLQVRICDDICDALELNQNDYSNASHVVNEWVVELHNNAQDFFPDDISKKYSWKTKG